jgi:hypothetical protein
VYRLCLLWEYSILFRFDTILIYIRLIFTLELAVGAGFEPARPSLRNPNKV